MLKIIENKEIKFYYNILYCYIYNIYLNKSNFVNLVEERKRRDKPRAIQVIFYTILNLIMTQYITHCEKVNNKLTSDIYR